MSRIGRMIRSAKMKARTPPKLMPPFQSTAASGTLPIEQTKLTIATAGPTRGPQNFASVWCCSRKKPRQNELGTQAASAPAIRRPPRTSRATAAQSITKYSAVAVKPSGERSRCQSERPSASTDMSISACPSIEPSRPFCASARASSTSRRVRKTRKRIARKTIINGPPTNSPSTNCQPRSSAMMIPSSITRFVEANWNAIAAVKSAPFRNSDRARATEAYEHDEEAAPRPDATASVFGESSGNSRRISRFETTACTAPESAKPRIRAQRTSQVIPKAKLSARHSSCPMATAMTHVVVEDLEGEAVECGRHGTDLCDDVDAVTVVLDHSLEAADLALDPVQTLDQHLLVLRIAVSH